MADVWPLSIPPTEKLILLKLADCANDDGDNAYPSIETMVKETGVCKRTVQYTLRKLQASSFISVQKGSTQHRSTIYHINLDAIRGAKSACLENPEVQSETSRGANDDVQGCKVIAPDPSLTVIESSCGANAPTRLFSEEIETKPTRRHQPITDAFLAELQAENPDVDVHDIYASASNLKRWDGYKDKRRGLRAEIGYARERREKFSGQRQPPPRVDRRVPLSEDPENMANWAMLKPRQEMFE